MSPGMEYQDTLPVCGTTYRCVRPAEGGEASWRRRDVQDGEVLVTCRTDALYAMAKAANCPIALRDAPERCRVGDMLRKEGDDAHRRHFSMDGSTLPDVLEADYVCTGDALPDASVKQYLYRGEDSLREAIYDAAPPVPPKPPAPTPPAQDPPAQDPPAQDPPAPAPPAQDPPAPVSNCRMPTGRAFKACGADADCPIDSFETWWRVAHKKHDQPSAIRPVDFLQKFNPANYSDWPDSREDLVRTFGIPGDRAAPVKLGTLKTVLQQMHRDSAPFRHAVSSMLAVEHDYVEAAQAARAGQCRNGTCAAPLGAPLQARYFDGTQDAHVHRNVGDSSTVSIEIGGVVHTANSQRCSEREDDCAGAVRLDAATAIAGATPPRDAYRVDFSDGEALFVHNAVQVTGSDKDSLCAAKLCQRHADQCPASLCRLDGGSCVPK